MDRMDRSSSHGDAYEDWPTDRLFALLFLICQILERRRPLTGAPRADPPELPEWRNRSPARSSSSWSVIGGPPCSPATGPPGQAPYFRSSTAPIGYNQAGGVGSRGRDAGPIAPFVCGYTCQFCEAVCSRNKTNHSHHRCRQHRDW